MNTKLGCRTASSYFVALTLAFLLPQLVSAQEHGQTAHPRFEDSSRWARVFEAPGRSRWQKPDQVVLTLGLKPGQTVIDIGAGTGYFTRRFARAVGPTGKAIGLDIEPGMIAYMQDDAKRLKLASYEARLVKPDDPELAPQSADLIFFCDVLHHVDHRVSYLKKLTPDLKPAGRVAVVDFKKTAPIGPPTGMKIPRQEMIAEFKEAGYRLVREHAFLPYQYFLEFTPMPAS
jgi:arsenite methyltransferase